MTDPNPDYFHPVPARVRMMFVMDDGSDFEVTLTPYGPPGVTGLRFIELLGRAGEPIVLLRLNRELLTEAKREP